MQCDAESRIGLLYITLRTQILSLTAPVLLDGMKFQIVDGLCLRKEKKTES